MEHLDKCYDKNGFKKIFLTYKYMLKQYFFIFIKFIFDIKII
jgi:hypothetical protein